MGRLVVAELGELVITAPAALVIATLGAGHQGTGGAGDRCHHSKCHRSKKKTYLLGPRWRLNMLE